MKDWHSQKTADASRKNAIIQYVSCYSPWCRYLARKPDIQWFQTDVILITYLSLGFNILM